MNKVSQRSAPLSKERIMLVLLIVGCVAIYYGVSQRPPAKDKLISVTAQVTKVVTVSERLKDNEAAAPSSVNPFESHDWIELAVQSVVPASKDGDPALWKIATVLSDKDLAALNGAHITALVKDLKYRSEAYEVTTDSGERLVSYADTAAGGNSTFHLFTILGGIACLASLILFVTGKRKSETALTS